MLRRLLCLAAAAACAAANPVENLVAFTRLAGYVRYFHPSDEAAAADWESFTINAIPRVEGAATAAGLARVLQNLFRPLAPTVQIYPTGEPPPFPVPERRAGVVAWRHIGVGLGAPQSIYSSRRVSSFSFSPEAFGNLLQAIDARPWRGRIVRLRAAVRAEVAGTGRAQLWLRVDRAGGGMGFFDNMGDRPITSPEWREYVLEGPVAGDAEQIYFGLMLLGEGKAWIDAVDLAPAVVNPDFEQPGLAGWTVPEPSARGGYVARVTSERPRRGKQCALLTLEKLLLPDPARPYEADLGAGVSARIPLALYADAPPPAVRPPGPRIASSTPPQRQVRLAAVILAWNVFQHFYPYFDVVQADWPAALRRTLQAAGAGQPDDLGFLSTLRRMVAGLQDGHGNVLHPSEPEPYFPPMLWSWVENALVVTVGGGGLSPGDVILRVNGRPAAEALGERELYISGATPQWKRYHSPRVLLAGPKDSVLTVETASRGAVTLARTVPARSAAEPRPEKVAELRPGVLYVDLDRATDQDYDAALPRLEKAQGIVFDLRGYPKVTPSTLGHLIDQPVTSPQWHIPVVMLPDRRDMTFDFSNWSVPPQPPRLRARVAFVTDGRAISYAETYLGIVEHYRLGEIVGEPTAGTNGNVNPFSLPGGYRVSWTGMKVLKHDGSRHHGVGIRPTVPVSRTIRGVREGRDELLERAVEVVGGAPP